MPRKIGKADKAAAVDERLKQMFRALEQKPTPDAIRSVVDQLDESPAASDRVRRRQA